MLGSTGWAELHCRSAQWVQPWDGWVGGRAGRGVSALGSTLTAAVALPPLDSPEESQVAWGPVPAGLPRTG